MADGKELNLGEPRRAGGQLGAPPAVLPPCTWHLSFQDFLSFTSSLFQEDPLSCVRVRTSQLSHHLALHRGRPSTKSQGVQKPWGQVEALSWGTVHAGQGPSPRWVVEDDAFMHCVVSFEFIQPRDKWSSSSGTTAFSKRLPRGQMPQPGV